MQESAELPGKSARTVLSENLALNFGPKCLSAESWLGGDNRSVRLNMCGGAARLSDLVASLTLLPE